MKPYLMLFLYSLIAHLSMAQATLILGGTAHLGNGEMIQNAAIAFEGNQLTLVEDASRIRIDRTKYDQVIDASGKDIYPGLIALNTQLGLVEIDAVRATRDDREVGNLNPSVRSLIAYNTDSRVVPTIRSNGVLMAQIVPKGGRISGQSSVVKLEAWNWEDAVVEADQGIHLYWPSRFRFTGWWAEPGNIKRNEKYDEQLQEIQSFLKEALAYYEKQQPIKNLKFEAMRGLFDGSKKLYAHTNNAKDMMEAIQIADDLEIALVLVGARESWQIIDILKEKNVPVVFGPVQSLPRHQDVDYDQPFKTPKALHDAGVPFALKMDNAWEQRNLPFQAGHAVGYGLPYEAAVQAITFAPARILGIDEQFGSLEKGKSATLIISEGDLLDMRTSKVEQAFFEGKPVDLSDKQKELYQKFKQKYEAEK